jgi:hypothetical protein
MAPCPPEPALTSLADPRTEYSSRLQARRAVWEHSDQLYNRVANLRFGIFLLGLLLLWPILGPWRVSPWFLLIPAVSLVLLALWHDRVRLRRARADRAVKFYELGLARLEERWAGQGDTGQRFLNPEHPYAADLDLFGTGSMFERLSAARTGMGEETLADWLLAPAAPHVIRERQAAVEELRSSLDLRESLALLGSDLRAKVDPKGLADWGAEPPALQDRWLPPLMHGLVLLTLIALAAWPAGLGSGPFLLMVLVEIFFAWKVAPRVNRVLAQVDRRSKDLMLLAAVLHRLEQQDFTSPKLARLRAALGQGKESASQRIATLGRLLDRLDWRRNQLFLPLAALLLWGTRHALAMDAWRLANGASIRQWLTDVGELEALGSLAGYAYENPDDPFSEIADQGPIFEGEQLGHPLLPIKTSVRNDLRLGDDLRLLVMSGSNMSGKSTMLRTVGLNAVLALAGAPVRAKRLRMSPLVIGATLRIQDSLQAGRSRFYAEIVRLRQLMDAARGTQPLLFLLDELLAGTNSHDRLHGAEGVVLGLVERGAVGIITTHDLALAGLAEKLGSRAANVHFADRLDGGTLEFDYRMRPGVVRHSNALALMRAVGLEV